MAKPFSRVLHRTLGTVVLAVVAAVVAWCSAFVLWMGDDVDYCFYINNVIWNSYGSIDNVWQFFSSQANHYFNVNGRYVAHVLVQLFCAVLGQNAFAVCNGLVYCAFIILLARTGGIRRPLTAPLALVGLASLSVLTFVTKMMPSTQIGFVWMFTLTMAWMRLACAWSRQRSPWRLSLLLVLSVIAGNGQEALNIGLSAAFGLWWLHRRGRVGPALNVALWGFWAGTVADCLSPATLNRADTVQIAFGDSVQYLLLSLRAVYMMVAVVLWQFWRHGVTLRTVWRRNSLWLIAMAVLLVFNLLVGVYSNRQLFGIELLALIVMTRQLRRHCMPVSWTVVAAAAAIALVSVQMYYAAAVKRQYAGLETLAVRAGGGMVAADRERVTDNPWLREYRYYEDLAGTGYADTHHSLQKLIRSRYPRLRYTKFKPAFLAGSFPANDTVVCCAPGHFVAVVHDKKQNAVLVHRRSSLTGRTLEPDTMPYARPVLITNHGEAWLVVPYQPFVDVTGLSIERKSVR